jgi:phosphotriesterase-related protein
VNTVLGVKDSGDLGLITPHEHIFVDIRNQFTRFPEESRVALAGQKVNMGNLDALSRDPYAVLDNLVMDDAFLAEKELMEFKKAGGDTIVDATSRGIGRNPQALKAISQSTGLHIVAGCGYYTQDTHPPDLCERDIDEIAEEMVRDLSLGIDGTGVKAGVIGEIGTSSDILPDEKKVLIAAARAHGITGAGIIVHIHPWAQNGMEAVQILTDNGANPNRISINHVDVVIDVEYCRRVANTGAYIEFDNFGKEYYIDSAYRGFTGKASTDRAYAGGVFARDIERVYAIKDLIDTGHIAKILMSTDVCLKTLLHHYGGWGYDHILTHIVPMLLEQGVTGEQIDTILRDNPGKLLDMERV